MEQAGDIAKMTSWYSVNLKLGKTLEVNFRPQPRKGGVREGVLNQNTHERGQSVNCIITFSTFTLQP